MNLTLPLIESEPGDDDFVGQAAAAVGATDLFVFRRITADRFVHVGGLGRGEGWAGNIDLILGDEQLAQEAVTNKRMVFVRAEKPVRIFGPYYQRSAVLVPLSADLIVVFGATGVGALRTEDGPALEDAAARAAAAISQVSSAKRLADELELLHAVHNLAQTDAVHIREVMTHVLESAISALSCDLGVLFVAELDAVEVVEHEPSGSLDAESFLPAMRKLLDRAATLPSCVQDSAAEPPPDSLDACGATSHYVLPVGTPPFGVLALMHTESRPRGFTSLCRQVGLRLAEAAEPLLRSALTLHDLEARLDRVGRDARIDPLTGLPNRRAWEEAVEGRTGAGTASVIVLDVDRLKAVNDERGHHFGDEFLQLISQVVSLSLRDEDFAARVGGDEFAVLLPGADEAICEAVACRITTALEAHPGLAGWALAASMGHATTPPAESVTDAWRAADGRMYQTKQQAA